MAFDETLRPRVPVGAPRAGEWRQRVNAPGELTDRLGAMGDGQYVPAATTRTLSRIGVERWWDRAAALSEANHADGDYAKMPERHTSDGSRTHRMIYEGAGVKLRMPSASAIRQFAAEGNQTFDVPMEMFGKHGAIAGWARVTRSGNRWHVTTLGDEGDNTSDAAAEAIASVLESRQVTSALSRTGDLVAKARSRRAGSFEAKPVSSDWIAAAGYDEWTGTLAVSMRRPDGTTATYGYATSPAVAQGVIGAESVGSAYNKLVKGVAPRAGVRQCPSCGRFTAAGNPHTCAISHGARPGPKLPPPPPLPPSQDPSSAVRERARRRLFGDEKPADAGVDIDDPTTAATIMAAVEQAAGGAAIRYRGAFSRDDVASAALGAITNRLRRAKTGESEPLVIDPAKGKLQNWVNRVVATEAHRLANGSNGREVGGRKRFAEARDAQASLLGRDLTTAEEDDLAEQLREEAPKNSRPSAGYHRRWSGAGSHISIDALPTSEGASSLSERFASPSASAASYEASVARASSRAASVRDDGARARSRTMVWEAYESAMPYAAPRLAGNDPAHAAKDRRAIRSMGGAGEVFAAWRRDELDSDVADRLFAPFADSRTFDRRLEIADTFGEFSSSHQSTLWESASNVASAQQAVSA